MHTNMMRIKTMHINKMRTSKMSGIKMNKNTISGNEKSAYKAESKWKNRIEKKALIALCSFSLLFLSAFPSFAENANNTDNRTNAGENSNTNNNINGNINAWNLEDNSISFFEVPELVNH